MNPLLFVLPLLVLVTGDDSQYCSTLTGYFPLHVVATLDPYDFGMSEERLHVSQCSSQILKSGKIELSYYRSYMEIVANSEDLDKNIVLRDDTFANLQDLEYLIIKGLTVEELQPHAFRGLDNLQYLSLHGLNLTTIPAEIFEDLPNLTELDLQENRIQSIDQHLFDKATNLERLDLTLNQVSSLAANWSAGLSNLRILSLWRNKLAELTPGIFDGLDKLEQLELNVNDYDRIEKDAFKGLDKLEYLSIKSGHLDFSLSYELEYNLKNLKSLYFYGVPRSDDIDKAAAVLKERKIECSTYTLYREYNNL